MVRVYSKGHFNIYASPSQDAYIVHNTRKEFKDGHTHLYNFKTAKFIIDLCLHKRIPHDLCLYHLESLRRLSDDKEYTRKLEELIHSKKSKKKQMYFNTRKKK